MLTTLLAKAFVHGSLARAIACVGRHVDKDPLGSRRPHFGSSFKLTSRMRTNSEQQNIPNGCFCVHIMLFSYGKFRLSKNFREFNFRCRLDQQKYFELFPIYGIIIMQSTLIMQSAFVPTHCNYDKSCSGKYSRQQIAEKQ